MALDFYSTLQPMVKEVARTTARRFPSNILAEDAEQAIWVWAYENKTSISNTILSEPKDWIAMVGTTMRRVAYEYCFNEKAAHDGTEKDDFQKYSYRQVKVLIEDIFDYEDWQSFGSYGDGQPKAKGQANQTGDYVTELIDVKDKVEKLREEQYNAIVWHYKYGYTFEQLAEEYDCSTDAARKRVERAVRAVAKALGPKDPEPIDAPQTGRRSVRSNAAWRAVSDNYYQE